MKKEKLIKKLQKLPDGSEVCVFDCRQNAYNATGNEDDSSNGIGIHPKFKIEHITDANKPFIALVIMNEDYTEECEPNYLSLLASNLNKLNS